MRPRVFVTSFLILGVLTASGVAINGDAASHGRRQSAIVYLHELTLIGSTIIQGPVVFVHDEAKMARGKPCTTVYLFEPLKGPGEEVASFHCVPKAREAVTRFTIRTVPNLNLDLGCILTEYQFAGDTEGHGVPAPPALTH